MVSPARLRFAKRSGSAISRSSSAKRSRLRSIKKLKSMAKTSAAADRDESGVVDSGQRIPLGFFNRASRFRAPVAAREFFDATGGVDKLLFAREKRMASG